jgi:geranyl-CoA carboxylase alpha subunit
MSSVNPYDSILVANRGEIAARIIRTAGGLGFRTIAVYSEADVASPHVAAADDAVLIGPAPVADSYLSIDRILAAAKESGAEAIHPGYGFLSENADFARACEKAGLVFIGPPADAIDLMGNKAEAKRRMLEAGVPCVPGYEGKEQADDVFAKAADEIGYPVMVKAAAGGGGRGMRLVADKAELAAGLDLARSEASNAFGSGELILEKAIDRPRHVEVQVFADNYGEVVHFGERDCSVQRRHQKVVEEAPCPVLTEELREAMGAAAVEAARSIGYRGAGTVEFLLDENGQFYFLEMNTRLQVEHPVTELVTGFDLVGLQIAVSQGEPLDLEQEDIEMIGHAIEVRLYAEDPAAGFLPSTGSIDLWSAPSGEGVRVDAGIDTGLAVSPFYDAMVAKIMAWGETRDVARRRLLDALGRTVLFGVANNRDFLMATLANETFAAGEATTAFIADEFPDAELQRIAAVDPCLLAAGAVVHYEHECSVARSLARSAAAELRNWSSSGTLTTRYLYQAQGGEFDVCVVPLGGDLYTIRCGDEEISLRVTERQAGVTNVIVDGRKQRVLYQIPEVGRVHVAIEGRSATLMNRLASGAKAAEAEGHGSVRAPMHGVLLELHVSTGQGVTKGDRLAVLEAMKMQHEITAEIDGVVGEVFATAGVQIAADDLILEIEAATSEATAS